MTAASEVHAALGPVVAALDVLGLLRTQGDRLDRDHLRRWE